MSGRHFLFHNKHLVPHFLIETHYLYHNIFECLLFYFINEQIIYLNLYFAKSLSHEIFGFTIIWGWNAERADQMRDPSLKRLFGHETVTDHFASEKTQSWIVTGLINECRTHFRLISKTFPTLDSTVLQIQNLHLSQLEEVFLRISMEIALFSILNYKLWFFYDFDWLITS